MSVSVGDVFVALGFQVDDKDLKQFDGGIRNLTGNILATVGAVSASLYALDRWIESSTSGAVNIRNLAQETGYNAEEMQKLAYAANAANDSLSFESALSSIGNLRKSLYDISQGKGNNSAWAMLNIDPNGKDPIQLIDELALKVHGMDRARASDLLDQTGLGRGYLSLLEEIYNNPNFIDQKGGPLVLSDEDLSTLVRGDKIINNMWKTLGLIKSEVTVSVFDQFTEGANQAEKAVDGLKKMWDNFYESMNPEQKKAIDEQNASYSGAWDRVKDVFSGGMLSFVKDFPSFMNNMIAYGNGTGGDPQLNRHMDAMKFFADHVFDPKYADTLPQETQKIWNGTTNVTVHVNGAQDPKAVADEIERAMRQRNNGARN